MAGTNWMGGHSTVAKTRFRNKADVKTKDHFARRNIASHFSAKHLNPFADSSSHKVKPDNPTFEFAHAQKDQVNRLDPITPPNRVADESSPTRITNRLPVPSKRLQDFWRHDPLSHEYNNRKILRRGDFTILPASSKRIRQQRMVNSHSEKDPIFPVPWDTPSAENAFVLASSSPQFKSFPRPAKYSGTPCRDYAKNAKDFLVDPPETCLNLIDDDYSFSNHSPRDRISQQSVVYNSDSLCGPSRLSHLAASPELLVPSEWSPSSLGSADLWSMMPSSDAGHSKESVTGEIEDLKYYQDPWEVAASAMNISLLNPDPTPSFALLDNTTDGPLISSERAGADFRLHLISPFKAQRHQDLVHSFPQEEPGDRCGVDEAERPRVSAGHDEVSGYSSDSLDNPFFRGQDILTSSVSPREGDRPKSVSTKSHAKSPIPGSFSSSLDWDSRLPETPDRSLITNQATPGFPSSESDCGSHITHHSSICLASGSDPLAPHSEQEPTMDSDIATLLDPSLRNPRQSVAGRRANNQKIELNFNLTPGEPTTESQGRSSSLNCAYEMMGDDPRKRVMKAPDIPYLGHPLVRSTTQLNNSAFKSSPTTLPLKLIDARPIAVKPSHDSHGINRLSASAVHAFLNTAGNLLGPSLFDSYSSDVDL